MTGYYDIILGLIPLSLIGITAAMSAIGVSVTAAVPVAATVPVALIAHALFVNGPVDRTSVATTQSASESNGFEAAD
ncbi:hypothetical protein [Halorussus marinus]|uniref:hypothetical protein n=1 Tax=Halorussus marinus TaxID=2505976 RepID=UPI00106E1720|nr:hypothetical protein [Halorussus marinus]